MGLHFAAPWMLAFVPVGIAYLVWAHRQSFVNLSPARRQQILLLRTVLVLTLTAAVAQPALIGKSRRAPVVLLADVSDSISDEQLAGEQSFVSQAWQGRGDRAMEVVTFAGHPQRAPRGPLAPRLERHDGGATNLAEAIAMARGLTPDRAPRIVLLSDGNDPEPEAIAAIEKAAREGVELDVATLGEATPLDARVMAIHAPETVRREQPTRFTVAVEATRAGAARLRLEENGFRIAEQTVELRRGSQSLDFDFEPTLAGLIRYRAVVTMPGDAVSGNDAFDQIVQVGGPPHVLLVSSTLEEGSHLEAALDAQEIAVEAISPGSLPSTLEGLLPYDEVILAGVAPFELDALRQGALASFVRDTGGGLLFLSGRTGLRRGTEGGARTLEALLPIELAAPSEREEPPVALVLLIDRSGSMVGAKLDYAKRAALAVIDKLQVHDQLGVIAFDARFEWIVPLHPLDDKEAVKAAVGSLGAGGGTKFSPALEEAYFSLASAETAVRHAILLTDGISTDPTEVFPPLLDKIRKSAITVSTVAIGRDADRSLPELARLGGGRYTLASRATEVPNIFVKETETIQHDAAQRADTRVKVGLFARELGGVDFAAAPPLAGYIRTRAKASSEVLLETDSHDPILVRWRYGLGEVAAFTSDATVAWAARWVTSWPDFGRLWAQLARGAQRPRGQRDLSISLEERGAKLAMRVEALDPVGHFLDELEVRVRVIDSSGQAREPALRQVGPGRYAGEVEVAPGSVLARPYATLGARRFEGDWATIARPYPRELERIGRDESRLAAFLHAGGGVTIDSPLKVTGPTLLALPRIVSLQAPLCMIALFLFVLDLLFKRARWEGR